MFGEITPAGREHFRGKLDATHDAFKRSSPSTGPTSPSEVGNGDTWLAREALGAGPRGRTGATSDGYLFRAREHARIFDISIKEPKSRCGACWTELALPLNARRTLSRGD